MQRRVLIVDDEPDMLEACEDALKKLKLDVVTEPSSLRAVKLLGEQNWDLLLIDLKMPDIDGMSLLKKSKEISPNTMVCMITGFPTIETAVEAVKLGAFDYVTKPFTPDQLQAVVQRALEQKQLKEENVFLRHQVEKAYKFDNILGKSRVMKKIFDLIQQVATTKSDVLITGESGTGKELIARSIHQRSKKQGKFVPVDCSAIPENLLESELFGYEKGAFTGAVTSRMGLLEFAHQGTFFLDEICELPASLQAKLLRTLQERSFRRIGSKEEIKVDVHVIAATNRDIDNEVKEKRFREDLYYRINVVRIDVPPLRERKEDIELLVNHYLDRYSREVDKTVTGIDHDALEVLQQYSWPGNIRELQNVIKRAITLSRGIYIYVDDLPNEIIANAGDVSTSSMNPGFFELRSRKLADFEREYFKELLTRYNGDAAKASIEARLPKGTFYRLIKKYNLRPESFRGQ